MSNTSAKAAPLQTSGFLGCIPASRRAEVAAILRDCPAEGRILERCKRGEIDCWRAMELLGLDPWADIPPEPAPISAPDCFGCSTCERHHDDWCYEPESEKWLNVNVLEVCPLRGPLSLSLPPATLTTDPFAVLFNQAAEELAQTHVGGLTDFLMENHSGRREQLDQAIDRLNTAWGKDMPQFEAAVREWRDQMQAAIDLHRRHKGLPPASWGQQAELQPAVQPPEAAR